jgi:TonB family protein
MLAAALAVATALGTTRASGAPPGVVPPQRLDTAPVIYPADGKGDASVQLAVLVDSAGSVTEVEVREGEPPFAESAAKAVRTWRFRPATRDGVPIAARIIATVTFHAPRAPAAAVPAETVSAPRAPAPARSPSTAAGPEGEPVEVSVRGEREEPGTNHIPRTETRFVPGAFGDPFRVIETLPGMAPWLSGLPYYYVRGLPPENVGYFVDGTRVPLLFHVGAGPSTLAPAIVDSVDLFSGPYPARYGRFAGAVIAGETTAPPSRTDPARGEFSARVFDADAFAEAPIDDGRGSVLAAGRYGYTGLLTSLIVPDYTVAYWDYQLRAAHRLADRDTVSLFVFGAYDELTYKKASLFRVEYHRADLRYDHPLRDGNLRLAATFGYDDTLTALQTDTGAGANAALKGPAGRVRAEIEQRIDARIRVRAGADFGENRLTADQYNGVSHPPHTDLEGGVYSDVVWRPANRVEFVPGVRLDGYRARGETHWAPQPRVAARIKLGPGLSWISAFGVAHQEPTEEVFVPAKLPDPIDESPRNSYHLSEGAELTLPLGTRVRLTAFESRLFAASGPGQERAEGLELFIRRDFTNRLGGFVSYTLSRSDTIPGARTLRSTWDRTHLLSVVLGYDLGSRWRVGARFFLESGRPYRALCATPDCSRGRGPLDYHVSGELPAFYRLDARIEKRWLLGGGRWLAGTIECFDVFNRPEPIGVDYAPGVGLSIRKQSPIILPSIGIEGGF